jgi:hypothetical protein
MSETNRVAMGREDDRNGPGRPAGGLDFGRSGCKDDVDLHRDQIGCHLLQLLDRVGPAELDDKVLTLEITEIAQTRPERLYPIGKSSRSTESENPNPRRLGRLLRAGNDRPKRRTAEKSDEVAALHSITSSARASVDGGKAFGGHTMPPAAP